MGELQTNDPLAEIAAQNLKKLLASSGVAWQEVKAYSDITYHKGEGIARIAFNRPEVRNAFRPQTIDQMIEAFRDAWMDGSIGVVLLTGNVLRPRTASTPSARAATSGCEATPATWMTPGWLD